MSELPCGRGRHRSPRSVASPAQRPRRLSSAFVFPVGGLPTSCASGEYETGCAYGDERIDVGEGASGDVGGRVTHRVPATSGSRLLHRQWDTERGLPESHATCKDGKLVDLIVDAATWSRPLRAHVADGANRPDLGAHSAPPPRRSCARAKKLLARDACGRSHKGRSFTSPPIPPLRRGAPDALSNKTHSRASEMQ